jgi:hypothetical protein
MWHGKRKTWRLPGPLGGYVVVSGDEPSPRGFARVSSLFVTCRLDGWLSTSASAGVLEDVARVLGWTSSPGRRTGESRAALKRLLAAAFDRGELVALQARPRAVPLPFPEEPTAPPPEPEAVEELTFVAIQLVDTDNQPVAHARYRLTLPDGGVREGRLSANGYVRVDRIPHGRCQVEFPGLGG